MWNMKKVQLIEAESRTVPARVRAQGGGGWRKEDESAQRLSFSGWLGSGNQTYSTVTKYSLPRLKSAKRVNLNCSTTHIKIVTRWVKAVLISLIVVIIARCIWPSNHHTAHLKHTQILLLKYTSIMLLKNKIKGKKSHSISCKWRIYILSKELCRISWAWMKQKLPKKEKLAIWFFP